MKKVVFLGLGYIGLPTAAVAAGHGYEVVGVDVNPSVVETINQGKIHIVEPELDQIVKEVVRTGNLRAVSKPEQADAFFVVVPTPFKQKPPCRYHLCGIGYPLRNSLSERRKLVCYRVHFTGIYDRTYG